MTALLGSKKATAGMSDERCWTATHHFFPKGLIRQIKNTEIAFWRSRFDSWLCFFDTCSGHLISSCLTFPIIKNRNTAFHVKSIQQRYFFQYLCILKISSLEFKHLLDRQSSYERVYIFNFKILYISRCKTNSSYSYIPYLSSCNRNKLNFK